MNYFLVILCVAGISAGQILFKITSGALYKTGSLFSADSMKVFIPAIGIYAVTTLAWIWLLQKFELGKVYPFMALAFVFVPVTSHIFFGEKFTVNYLIGIMLIVVGIIFTVKG